METFLVTKVSFKNVFVETYDIENPKINDSIVTIKYIVMNGVLQYAICIMYSTFLCYKTYAILHASWQNI